MDVSGSSVIVTGGASGLGAATAKRFAEAGATVFGLDLQPSIDKAAPVDNVHLIATDVTKEDEVKAAIAEAVKAGPLRVAVNCAGVGWAQRILSKKGVHPLDLFQTVININLVGTFNVMRLAAEQMSQQETADAQGSRGLVVNTASVAAFEGQIGQIAYTASKGGVHAMTITAARDLAQFGIRVNTIAPGTINTPMLAGVTDEFKKTLEAGIPFPQRLGEPAEYAQLAYFLAEHDYINGETIRMDGALRMAPR
ncbi:Short-chain dehydrogenase/reductase SDR OS=Tsukamurella paurometabola (strain ATCC 8368 / DSM/ CCUG 35730 / CIP 100753 / JCM 10117 / KCTC 9821 / NBRC 16120/ NCIMB 702349 / NCTC 13040) OX=521096 GN=Tpau_0124 PE=4 SV=1 [Tsukamurella paurometabola]|uniref:Short-chain dehydrogenase/reductase SDR n=1 Tax=Tsukamurella paurometabola (strain ATCC 8368 / DSM 20162 / CCUG 35730 / CIP 100753 / JCM 10117 / KCTC 9821 / NBRC 16120 / NCIMB 702349 / NCTC 13040) TaxID=521096 RepID=D5UQ10_TSUPD|nr:SDR family oxidoreductase [Tsukamurella paurometabola]ADG76778.1 short-chain dehydrogenase/reductase SDR [Tsukamurella paurometabola DSM 20162]SUP41592.1 3-oxoacyl-[acyl-carrier-protein] reductase FabG [Tsukamurella paurometabola]